MAGQLPLEPSYFRAEAARYRIEHKTIAEFIGMHRSVLCKYMNEQRDPVYAWALHNIGYALNTLIGKQLFRVAMEKGILRPKPGKKKVARSKERYALLPLMLDDELPKRRRRRKREAV